MLTFYSLLADALLLLHGLIVIFNVGALLVIWLGYFRKWSFVRSFSFRMIQLMLIGYIAAGSILGTICPLTTWENQLRIKAGLDQRYQGGYIAHWVHNLLFYDLDARVFTIAYISFFALVLFTLYAVKPKLPHWGPRKTA